MRDLFQRLRVLLGALPTWLTAAAAVLSIVADDIAEVLPFAPGTATTVAAVIITFAGILTAAATIVSRVTPVLDQAVGLLPPPPGVPITEREVMFARALNDQRQPTSAGTASALDEMRDPYHHLE